MRVVLSLKASRERPEAATTETVTASSQPYKPSCPCGVGFHDGETTPRDDADTQHYTRRKPVCRVI